MVGWGSGEAELLWAQTLPMAATVLGMLLQPERSRRVCKQREGERKGKKVDPSSAGSV